MIGELHKQIDAYLSWLRDRTSLRQVGDWVEITTPFLDRHNDCVQIFARPEDQGFVLTDDSYTIHDLRLSGCDVETPKRRQLLETVLNGFGVRIDGDELSVVTTAGDFGRKKHCLVQAMLAANDLFYTARAHVASLFLEDVTEWLDAAEVRYTPTVKFAGRSGYDHLFHFVIPRSSTQPERILQAVNRPMRSQVQQVAFAWGDTRESRADDSRAYALLNDAEEAGAADARSALIQLDVRAVLWSRRDEVREELAA